jgi:ribosomal protein S18 acetylase RimI-like enzyme
MNEKLLFAKATIDDAPQLVTLVNSAYRGESSRNGWTHEADLIGGNVRIDKNSVIEIIQQHDSVVLKCINENKIIVGCVHLEKQEDQLYLGMLSVNPQIQANGIGKQLLQAAELHALQVNCIRIMMTVISLRTELISWYQRNGYVDTGVRKPFPNDPRFGTPVQPLEFVVLEKRLN